MPHLLASQVETPNLPNYASHENDAALMGAHPDSLFLGADLASPSPSVRVLSKKIITQTNT